MSEGSPLQYVEKPPEVDHAGAAPAVVLVHGRGADERDLVPISDQLPDELHVFSVRAPVEMEDGYRWYEIDLEDGGIHSSQPDPETFRKTLVRLFKFLEYITEAYDVHPGRIGILGFSQGATLGLAGAVQEPDRIAWVVGLNGYLPKAYGAADKLAGVEGVPIFLAAGRMDLVIPKDRVKRAADRLQDAGLDVRFETYPVGHGANDEEIEEVGEWVTMLLENGY